VLIYNSPFEKTNLTIAYPNINKIFLNKETLVNKKLSIIEKAPYLGAREYKS